MSIIEEINIDEKFQIALKSILNKNLADLDQMTPLEVFAFTSTQIYTIIMNDLIRLKVVNQDNIQKDLHDE